MSKVVRVTFDMALDDPRAPSQGDVVITARAVYRVTEARPVDSAIWANRWRLHLRREGSAADTARLAHLQSDGREVFRSRRYRPGETPQSHFGEAA